MKRIVIWVGIYLAVGFVLLASVAPTFTLHRREALYAYTRWLREPSPGTRADYYRQMERNNVIQYEISAVGSLLICASMFGVYALGRKAFLN